MIVLESVIVLGEAVRLHLLQHGAASAQAGELSSLCLQAVNVPDKQVKFDEHLSSNWKPHWNWKTKIVDGKKTDEPGKDKVLCMLLSVPWVLLGVAAQAAGCCCACCCACC